MALVCGRKKQKVISAPTICSEFFSQFSMYSYTYKKIDYFTNEKLSLPHKKTKSTRTLRVDFYFPIKQLPFLHSSTLLLYHFIALSLFPYHFFASIPACAAETCASCLDIPVPDAICVLPINTPTTNSFA